MEITFCLMCGEPLQLMRSAPREWIHHNMTVEQIDLHGKIFTNHNIDDHHLNNPIIPRTWQLTWT